MSGTRKINSGIWAVIVVIVALVAFASGLLIGVNSKQGTSTTNGSPTNTPKSGPIPPQRLPSNVIKWVEIAISNNQSVATSSPFVEKISWPVFAMSRFASSSLSNVEFFYSNGTLIPSCLFMPTSLPSVTSNAVGFYLKLHQIPAQGRGIIYAGFGSNSTSFLNGKAVGEAPWLSKTYGEYDNGASIFTYYQQWGNLSRLPLGWHQTTNTNVTFNKDNVSIYTTTPGTISWYGVVFNATQTFTTFPAVIGWFGNIYATPSNGAQVGMGDSLPNISYGLYEGYIQAPYNILNTVGGVKYNTNQLDFNGNKLYSVYISSPTELTSYVNNQKIATSTSLNSASDNLFFMSMSYSGRGSPTAPIYISSLFTLPYPPNGVMPYATISPNGSQPVNASSGVAATSMQLVGQHLTLTHHSNLPIMKTTEIESELGL